MLFYTASHSCTLNFYQVRMELQGQQTLKTSYYVYKPPDYHNMHCIEFEPPNWACRTPKAFWWTNSTPASSTTLRLTSAESPPKK
ncbi:hypothetical protein Pelo_19812 [Pelomyxa schiedti]|nr:hypothetical protein Pelo_19812 [Pelomyxa schiedti]